MYQLFITKLIIIIIIIIIKIIIILYIGSDRREG
jgi:hypothetical protein